MLMLVCLVKWIKPQSYPSTTQTSTPATIILSKHDKWNIVPCHSPGGGTRPNILHALTLAAVYTPNNTCGRWHQSVQAACGRDEIDGVLGLPFLYVLGVVFTIKGLALVVKTYSSVPSFGDLLHFHIVYMNETCMVFSSSQTGVVML